MRWKCYIVSEKKNHLETFTIVFREYKNPQEHSLDPAYKNI